MTESAVATLAGFPTIAPGPVQAIVSKRGTNQVALHSALENDLTIVIVAAARQQLRGESVDSDATARNPAGVALRYGRRTAVTTKVT